MQILSFQLTTLQDQENILLGRREVKYFIKEAAGKISRLELISLIEKNLGIQKDKIYPIELKTEKGKNHVNALVYIYDKKEQSDRQLPKYRILRRLSKEERKKILDEEKAAKLKAKQAAKADAK
jgi:small subunit ribosomal protein S24e